MSALELRTQDVDDTTEFRSMNTNIDANVEDESLFREWEKSIPLTIIKRALNKLQLFTLLQKYYQHCKSRYTFISPSQKQHHKKN